MENNDRAKRSFLTAFAKLSSASVLLGLCAGCGSGSDEPLRTTTTTTSTAPVVSTTTTQTAPTTTTTTKITTTTAVVYGPPPIALYGPVPVK